MIIIDVDLILLRRIYESVPWSVEAWTRPLESCALASTRLAGAGTTSNGLNNNNNNPISNSHSLNNNNNASVSTRKEALSIRVHPVVMRNPFHRERLCLVCGTDYPQDYAVAHWRQPI